MRPRGTLTHRRGSGRRRRSGALPRDARADAQRCASRLFTDAEAHLSVESLAARFAAKEAFVKALRAPAGMPWQDIEVVNDPQGAPVFQLYGAALDRAKELGITTAHLSISHDTSVATAFVVAEC